MMRKLIRWMASSSALLLVFSVGSVTSAAGSIARAHGDRGAYVVRADSEAAAAAAVERAGAHVDLALDLVDGVAARLDDAALAELSAQPGVKVTPDVAARVTGEDYSQAPPDASFAALDPPANWSPNAGEGVSVALIDTGVAPVDGLDASRIVQGPDLSGEGDGVDRYGHGTFMAGLIVGQPGADGTHHGVVPGATLVSVKVAGADGETTLSRVIAGIGWVVVNEDRLGVRVMNLSLGADMPMSPQGNPLDAAVEAAWAAGITVVTAAGNQGAEGVTSPGDDPWVITVGATDTQGTSDTSDDTLAAWSGRDPHNDKPDLLAPGVSVVSLRAPGSTIDVANPSARVGDDYFVGTGTSMSTALATGAAALLAEHHPLATPDDLKGALGSVGTTFDASPGHTVDIAQADVAAPQESWWQRHRVAFNGLGIGLGDRMPWTGARWSGDSWNADRWSAARWSAARWSAARWSGARWSAARWSGARWSDGSWAAARWSAARWAAARWC